MEGGAAAKTASNFLVGQVFRRLTTDEQKEAFALRLKSEDFTELCTLVDGGKLRMNLAKNVLEKMLDSGEGPKAFISEEDLQGVDQTQLEDVCRRAVAQNQKAVSDYLEGKEKALKALLGFVMKETRGRADAQAVEAMLKRLIAEQ